MKKKILAIGLVVCMLVVAIGSATMAYFTDTEEVVENVMTVGEVDIYMDEEFNEDLPLLPNVEIEKLVEVENQGTVDAYVRVLLAVEDAQAISNKVTLDYTNESYLTPCTQTVIKGTLYTVYEYVYPYRLGADESFTSLESIFWNDSLTQEEAAILGDSFNVLVMAQAVQADGVADNAKAALDTAFGVVNYGYAAELFGGVVPNYVANADELATALTNTTEDIAVVLQNDIDVPITSLGDETPGSGEYKLGGDNTKSISIDLYGHKLNIITTYMSAIGAKNADAVFTIKNGSMTSSKTSGTWDTYNLIFDNCNYVIENVTFEKSVALCNEGKTATLKDVTINETHDYYALWISAAGQDVTIDGLTVNCSNGRGIKIDAEYVDSPAEVTLDVSDAKFITAKKAAILVDSSAGANIKLDDMDIRKVAADSVNPVWIDEDAVAYYDKVKVTGGTVVVEPVEVKNSDELNNAIKSGKTNLVLSEGDFTANLYNIDGRDSLTIVGSGAETKLSFSNLQVRADLFNEMTISNCTIERMPNKKWGHLVFSSSSNANGVYTIENCIFNGVGSQGIYINETVSGATYNIKNCTFKGDFGGEGAITIQNNDGVDVTVNVTDCIFDNVPTTSHEIYVIYAYDGWTLNAPGVTAYWKANP